MKRNMVPLLGIAFVVAIISTGVFYGLFAGRLHSASADGPGQSIVVAGRNLDRGTVIQATDLRVSQLKGSLKGSFDKPQDVVGATLLEAVNQNEPLLEDRVASLGAKSGGTGQKIPAGMRAVSIRVSESTGIVALLHAGSRVDVQAVLERSGMAELRTILQNVEVLAVGQQNEPVPGRPPAPVVTVLAKAQDSDSIALADSSARIRVALRNPLDEATSPRHSLGLTALFNGSNAVPISQNAQKSTADRTSAPTNSTATSNFDHPILLRVQVLGASDQALKELDSQLTAPDTNGSWNVASFRSDADVSDLVRTLEQKQELEVVSAWKFTAGIGRPVSFRAGQAPYQLRVQFSPETESGGKVCLRVKPETIFQRGEGIETRKYDAVPGGGSFLVRGFLKDPSDRKILDRLYPGHAWSTRDLVILVTARADGRLPASAFAQTNRGQ